MWTKNGKKYFLKTLLLGTAELEYIKSTGESITTAVKYNSLTHYNGMNIMGSINSTATAVSGGTGFGVFCGSGDTPPTEDDYTLAEPLTLGYVAGSITNTTINKVIQYTVQNNNTEAVTIRELGLCLNYRYGSTQSSCFIILLNRKLLPTPITLEVGEQAIITFTVDTSNIIDGDGWTNNFKVLACDQLLTKVSSQDTYTNVLGLENNSYNGYPSGVASSASQYQSDITTGGSSGPTANYYTVYAGTGTNPTAEDSYTLDLPVQLTYQDANITIDNDNNALITYTLQNTSTETYTISEICLCTNFRKATSFYNVMFNRKLLPTPVVMEPNDSYVFTYTINTSNLSE